MTYIIEYDNKKHLVDGKASTQTGAIQYLLQILGIKKACFADFRVWKVKRFITIYGEYFPLVDEPLSACSPIVIAEELKDGTIKHYAKLHGMDDPDVIDEI